MPEAEWRGPLPETNYAPGGNRRVIGMVVHHMDGSWQSAEGRFKTPGAQASACFGVRFDGSIIQWVDTGDFDYHACMAQWRGFVGVENESNPNTVDAPLTDQQVDANARIARFLGIELKVCDGMFSGGVSWHRQFPGVCSQAWGQTDCPGDGIEAQISHIVAVAQGQPDPDVQHEWKVTDGMWIVEKRDNGQPDQWWEPAAGGLVQLSAGEAYARLVAGVPHVEYPTLGILGYGLRLRAALRAAA